MIAPTGDANCGRSMIAPTGEGMELPKRKPNRLPECSYDTPGAYFITICSVQRGNVFWKDVGAIIDRPENVPLNEIGRIVDACIREIPKRYPEVSVDHYVVMPDHVHLLLQIHDGRSMIAPTGDANCGRSMIAPTEDANDGRSMIAPTGDANCGRSMIAPTIGRVVKQMKGAASKGAGRSLWQKSYYDHVIRGQADYLDAWNYIEGNPGKRETDLYC